MKSNEFMKKYGFWIGIICIAVLAISLIFSNFGNKKSIGGQKDEYGCLGSAGYTYNKEVNACVREWELNDDQKKAAKIAVKSIGYDKGITIIQVLVARCPGCFTVEIEKGKDRIKITLDNWEIKITSLTPKECENLGGKSVNTVGGEGCSENEENIGEVVGFISPNICCVPR
jgi:hypothetical protein